MFKLPTNQLFIIGSIVLVFIAISIIPKLMVTQQPKEELPVPVSKLPEEINPKNPQILIETSLGQITLELFPEKAPLTVENFLKYTQEGFYDGTIFHRVIPNFMIQGGGFLPELEQKPTAAPIKNEADNGLPNLRGTIAMARTNVVDSATAQFFINVVDNDYLNHRSKTPDGYGYCVFGRVIKGIEVVDKIAAVPTATVNYYQNVPKEAVLIISAKQINQE